MTQFTQFDNYGINAFDLWYDAEDMMIGCGDDDDWSTGFDSNGDCISEYHGSGEGMPQPLGPSVPYLQGPRSLEEINNPWHNNYPCTGFNASII